MKGMPIGTMGAVPTGENAPLTNGFQLGTGLISMRFTKRPSV